MHLETAACYAQYEDEKSFNHDNLARGDIIKEDDTTYDNKTGERVFEGLRWKVAPDRLLVRSGKYVEPEGLDVYLGKKLDKIYNSLTEISTILSSIEKRLHKLDQLEEISSEIDSIKLRLQKQEGE